MDSPTLKIGGFTDHIHILCLLSKRIALSKLIQELKAHSSKWLKTKENSLKNFYWQDACSAFSVNPSEIDFVIKYVSDQHKIHAKTSFQNEILSILKQFHIDYDERYLWE